MTSQAQTQTQTTAQAHLQPIGSSAGDGEGRTLYVGGLDERVEESELQAAFIAFGEIVEVEVAREAGTGAHKGYGFVTYEAGEDAEAAVENMNHSEMYGRVLRVGFARGGSGNASGSAARRRPVWEDEAYYAAQAAQAAAAAGGGGGGGGKGERVVYKSVQNEGEGFNTDDADSEDDDDEKKKNSSNSGSKEDGTKVRRVFFAPRG